MKRVLHIILLFLFVLLVKSCYYDVAEELYPCAVAETVTYKENVSPVISTNCYGCHSIATAASGNNIILEGYDNLKKKVDDGKLLCAISHGSGCSPMPKGGAKLGSCTIAEIQKWVEDGAPNN